MRNYLVGPWLVFSWLPCPLLSWRTEVCHIGDPRSPSHATPVHRNHITKCFTWIFWWKWKSQLFTHTRVLWLAGWVMIQHSTPSLLGGSSFFLSWLDLLDVSQSAWLNILMIFPQSIKKAKIKAGIKKIGKFSFILLLWIIFSFPIIHLLFLLFCFVLVSLLNCDIFNQQIVPLWCQAVQWVVLLQCNSSHPKKIS